MTSSSFEPAAEALAFLALEPRTLGARTLGGLAVRRVTRERAEARATATYAVGVSVPTLLREHTQGTLEKGG